MMLMKSILKFGMRRRWPGFGFVTSQLYPRGIVSKTKYDFHMILNPYQAVEGSVLFDGFFDEPVLLAIKSHLKENDVFWDIGANVGLHSFAVKKLMPKVECVAFEPFHENFERLCANQALNKDLQITKCNVALSDDKRVVDFYTTANNAGRTGINPMEGSVITGVKGITITGDELVKMNVPSPNVIKLDTEGSELAILKGCKNILADKKLRAVIYESFDQASSVARVLTESGFDVQPLDDRDNFIAIRK